FHAFCDERQSVLWQELPVVLPGEGAALAGRVVGGHRISGLDGILVPAEAQHAFPLGCDAVRRGDRVSLLSVQAVNVAQRIAWPGAEVCVIEVPIGIAVVSRQSDVMAFRPAIPQGAGNGMAAVTVLVSVVVGIRPVIGVLGALRIKPLAGCSACRKTVIPAVAGA